MAGRKPDPRRAVRDGLQEIAEPFSFVSPRVNRLAQKRNVPRASGDEVLYLPDHTLHRAADHTPPHGGDYAVTALVVASGHYRDEGVVPTLSARKFGRVRLLHRR